jgi:hypothetical protein
MDNLDIGPIMWEWLAIFLVLIVALNVWVRRYLATLKPKERAEVDEQLHYDIQNW